MSYTDEGWVSWKKISLYLGVYLVLMIVLAFFLIPYSYPDGLLAWLIIVIIGGLLTLGIWQTTIFAYYCPLCDHEFEILFIKDLFSIQGADKKGKWKLIKCPKCDKRSKKYIIEKE